MSRLIRRRQAGLADSGDQADLLRLRALLALRDLKLHALTVFQRLVAVHLDRGEVDEHVLPPVDRDETVALLAVEPLDGALCHGALPLLRSFCVTHSGWLLGTSPGSSAGDAGSGGG